MIDLDTEEKQCRHEEVFPEQREMVFEKGSALVG